jgi:hypothetical protein
VVIRHFDEDEPEKEKVEKTTVEVYSEHLRKTLATVIDHYPGISFHTEVRQSYGLDLTRLNLFETPAYLINTPGGESVPLSNGTPGRGGDAARGLC